MIATDWYDAVWAQEKLSTREEIGLLRMMSERSLEHDHFIYVCFVDFEKVFDNVIQMSKTDEHTENHRNDW